MWKDWLNYSRSQRYGTIVLLLLVILVAFYPLVYQTFFFTPAPLLDADGFYRIDSFFTSLTYSPRDEKPKFSFIEEERPSKPEPELFPFDPNTVTIAELMRLGLSSRQTAVIENYRNKGGTFRDAAGFSKMYVIDSTTFLRLKNYIRIDPRNVLPDSGQVTTISRQVERVYLNLNAVDTLQITQVKGIGRSYARRIIDYRQRLGGFYGIHQLMEVYGFSHDLFDMVKPQIWADSTFIQKKNINIVDYYELREHPYLTDYQARAIIYYRETMGNFNQLEDIVKNKLVDTTTFSKLKHYITVN